MCGILGVKGKIEESVVAGLSKRLTHRGGDERGIVQIGDVTLAHERLSIIDLTSGIQPIKGCSEHYLVHNGEIYNHLQLREELAGTHKFHTQSDSEVILHLFEEMGAKCLDRLDGVFALMITDGEKLFVARDPIGVKPLFYGKDEQGRLWFASEYKALADHCLEFAEFPAGHYYTDETGFVKYYQPAWETEDPIKGPEKLRIKLEAAVRKRLMSDVPLGVFLSGGLDSSLVASIMARECKKQGMTLRSFSVGVHRDSPDLKAARAVAEFLGTEHHEVVFSVEQGISELQEIVKQLETYDVTTIRAGVPMYILSRYIRKQGIKVVLSGEGADEIFGGYLYFRHAPTDQELHEECKRRMARLHSADVLRVDRTTMGHALEARVPFLDKEFLEESLGLDPKYKRAYGEIEPKIEKHVLRAAFDTPEDPYLPREILWRQKEQFSDGVGYSWIDSLKDYAEKQITEERFSERYSLYPHNTPDTKEGFFYRELYDQFYPQESAAKIVKRWVPKWQTDKDPSGRANSVHTDAYQELIPEVSTAIGL